MSPREAFALRDYLGPDLKGRTISDARQVVSLTDILEQTCLADRLGELSGRSVLLAVADQLISGLVMTELDGVARRMLLCPPDLNADHLQSLMQDADIDAVVTDDPERWADAGSRLIVTAGAPAACGRQGADRAGDGMADADVGHLGRAEDRRPYPGRVDRRDRRRQPGAQAARRSGRPSTIFAAMAAFRFSCAPSSAAARWCCRSPGEALADHVARLQRARRHAYFRHAVALAQAADERIGRGVFAALRPAVGRDRRPGRA